MEFSVAYACNEAYKEQTMVSMLSLCSSCREDAITIFLIEDGMREASLNDMRMLVRKCRKRLEIVPLHSLLDGLCLGDGGRHPHTIYAKLFLPDICQADKILYLDSDTVILGPLSPLMGMDMGDASVAGVKMPYTAEKKAAVGLSPEMPYVCDGVLLMDLEKWRRDHLTKQCVSYIRRCGGNPPMLSEGAVNYAAHGSVKALPPKYNVMSGMLRWDAGQLAKLYGVADYYGRQELMHAREHPVILHYLDELYIRPWYRNSDHPYRAVYQAYRRLLWAGMEDNRKTAGKETGRHKGRVDGMPTGKLRVQSQAGALHAGKLWKEKAGRHGSRAGASHAGRQQLQGQAGASHAGRLRVQSQASALHAGRLRVQGRAGASHAGRQQLQGQASALYAGRLRVQSRAGVLHAGKLRVRTRILRMMDRTLPFWLFAKIYRAYARRLAGNMATQPGAQPRRKTNVLLIYERFIASVRLCGYEQFRCLEEKGRIHFQHSSDSQVTAGQCQWADILVFVRNATWLSYKIARENKKRGKMVVYVLDDDLLAATAGLASARYYSQEPVRQRIWWFLENSDALLSPSRYLLNKYQPCVKRVVRMEEPCMGKNMRLGAARKKGNKKLKIGFAGSPDRSGDVQNLLQEALELFYSRHKKEVELEFMGAKIDLASKLHLACYPYEESYQDYQRVFSRLHWDIGLAPMQDTEFHRSKHYNKYMEYASIGCVGIYSRCIPYTYVIEDRENGILCENTLQGWLDALEWCLANQGQIREMKKRVASEMERDFSIETVAGELTSRMPELVGHKAGKGRKCAVPLYRAIGMSLRCIEFLQRYKKDFPQKLAEKLCQKRCGALGS